MIQVAKDRVVSFRYIMRNSRKEILEDTTNGRPTAYLHGTSAIQSLLQDQLEGTENRIKVSRDQFNNAVKEYNIKVSNFPGNIFAGMFHFKEMGMFQADADAQKAPKVQF